ncbi:HAD-IA family hydrolase [Streptomyces sp. NPDC088270]|uniref:HAD-IA family hydrolase n=1 Tax=Streptomyces sp. NPDC088270 TaxID=3160990 RepID=UPI0034260E83
MGAGQPTRQRQAKQLEADIGLLDKSAVVIGELEKITATKDDLPQPRVLVTADDVDRGKPDPEGYLSAACQLAVSPAKCLVFDDAMSGVQASKQAGMRAVLLGDEAHSSKEI